MKPPSWRSIFRALALLIWAYSIYWWILEPGILALFISLIGLLNLLLSFHAGNLPASSLDITALSPQQLQTSRQNMLQLVHNSWVEGVLKKSLHYEVLGKPGEEALTSPMKRPWDIILQTPGQDPQPLSPGTPMLEVFERLGGSMLILGEPGSGKTTLLLELASQLIQRTKKDPRQPIPVVFHLSSWEVGQSPASWFVAELQRRYDVPEKIAIEWVNRDRLALLLDGLDEIPPERSVACMQAISRFRSAHSAQLALCARAEEGEATAGLLDNQGALVLQPLSEAQVEAYLDRVGFAANPVREGLKQDEGLRELAQSPLMLNLLLLTYQDTLRREPEGPETVEARRRRLIEAYIDRGLSRRDAAEQPYPEAKARGWLTWLAKRMNQFGRAIFFIEDLRTSWRGDPKRVRWAEIIITAVTMPVFGLANGLVFWKPGEAGGIMEAGIGFGTGLLTAIFVRTSRDEKIMELFYWSWSSAAKKLGAWLGAGLAAGLIVWTFFGVRYGLGMWLIFWLSVWCVSWLSRKITVKPLSKSNQGIIKLVQNVIAFSVSILLLLFLGSVLLGLRLSSPLRILSIILGTSLALAGYFLLYHYPLRWLLARAGEFPWDYTAFLDDAVERGLLRRVGRGYVFVHGMVRDYFAGEEVSPRIKPKTE